MASRVIGTARRSRRNVAIIAAALMLTVIVLLAQASSIWSSGTASRVRPATQVGNSQDVERMQHHLLPPNCHVKYGCTAKTTGQP